MTNIKKAKSIRHLGRIVLDQSSFWNHKWHGKRPLVKDPIAFFAAEWLYQTFDMDVVLLIHHPATFYASLKVKNWQFDFNNFQTTPADGDRSLSVSG